MLKDEFACLFVLNPFLEPTSIKQLGFIDQEKNGSFCWVSNLRLTDIHRLQVRRATHCPYRHSIWPNLYRLQVRRSTHCPHRNYIWHDLCYLFEMIVYAPFDSIEHEES